MTYQLRQDANGSTLLAARAQAVLAAQGRVAAAAVEMRRATEAFEAASAAYEATSRHTSGSWSPADPEPTEHAPTGAAVELDVRADAPTEIHTDGAS